MAFTYRIDDSSDQIDLAKYAAPIARRWKLVLGVTVLAVVVAVIVTTALAQIATRYQSTMTILLTGPRYKVSFDPKFATVDSPPAATRADEYRTLAASPEVQLALIQALSGQLTPEEVESVATSITIRGQLIVVNAIADNPERATLVSNAYAKAVAARLDAVYGENEQDRQAIAKKLDETIAAHEKAQSELTAFTRESRIDALGIQVAQKESMMQSLAEEQASSLRNRLAGYYEALAEADQIVRTASGLRAQVQAAADASQPATGTSISLATLQSRLAPLGVRTDEIYVDLGRSTSSSGNATSDRTPGFRTGSRATVLPQLQLQLNAESLARADADPTALLASIDALIASTRAQQADVRRAIDELSQQAANGGANQDGSTLDATIAQLASELSALQAEYRAQTFRRDVLTQNIELAKSTRTTLEAKLTEVSVAADAAGGGAILVSGAIPSSPIWPLPLSRILPPTIAGGLILGVLAALALEWKSARWSAPEQPTEVQPPALVH